MKLIVAGSRTITDRSLVFKNIRLIEKEFFISEIVEGGARGVDTLAKEWAIETGHAWKELKADWDRYGLAAGYKRNMKQAKYGDALLAIWDGKSLGTRNMIREMMVLKKPVFVIIVEKNNGKRKGRKLFKRHH